MDIDMEQAAELFKGWNKALIWSCLQGHMGEIAVDDSRSPKSAMVNTGDFCFFAGRPNIELFESIGGFKLLIPRDERWERLIESHFGNQITKTLRYAIKHEPDIFQREKLTNYIDHLAKDYEVKLFDREIFRMAKKEQWSADLCSQFQDYEEYERKAVGAAILYKGELVSGASPYAVYDGGIEIEIDTKPEYRKRGLATVCGARLIIACMERQLYPSWDAHDLRSVALAEKLGYHLDHSYVTYEYSERNT